MTDVVAYYPTIPEIESTMRYQHAKALCDSTADVLFCTHSDLPGDLRPEDTKIISGGTVDRAREAASIVSDADPGVCITSYHYEAATAGYLARRKSNLTWAVDVFEVPAQYRLNHPVHSYHNLTSRCLDRLLDTADIGIHSNHEDSSHTFGRERYFMGCSAPVDLLDPAPVDHDTPELVWVGSPRWDRGGEILVGALERLSTPLSVTVLGRIDERVCERLQATNHDTVHVGRRSHETCLTAISHADIGYCVLPDRSDWKYAYPTKVGEYLAGGTIPLVSTHPGPTDSSAYAGVAVDPDPASVAAALQDLADMDPVQRTQMQQAARKRAEAMPWADTREQFLSVLGIDSAEKAEVTA